MGKIPQRNNPPSEVMGDWYQNLVIQTAIIGVCFMYLAYYAAAD